MEISLPRIEQHPIEKFAATAGTAEAEWYSIYVARGVVTEEECAKAIADAELFAQEHGWGQGRHAFHPTVDLGVLAIPGLAQWLHSWLVNTAFPLCRSLFALSSSTSLASEHSALALLR